MRKRPEPPGAFFASIGTTDYRARMKRGIPFNPGKDDELVVLAKPEASSQPAENLV